MMAVTMSSQDVCIYIYISLMVHGGLEGEGCSDMPGGGGGQRDGRSTGSWQAAGDTAPPPDTRDDLKVHSQTSTYSKVSPGGGI